MLCCKQRMTLHGLLVVLEESVDSFVEFVDHFMPAVKGEKRWGMLRQECCSGEGARELYLSDHATISDEAFLIVCIENYKEVWDHQIRESIDNRGKEAGEEVGKEEVSERRRMVVCLDGVSFF